MASLNKLFDGTRDGVAVTVERRDAKGIAGFHDRVNGGRSMHRCGGAKLRHRHGDLLAMSPFHGIPVLTPAEFPEGLIGR